MQRKCLRERSIGSAHPTRSSEDPGCTEVFGMGLACLGGGIRQGSPHPRLLGRHKSRECDSMEHHAATRQPQHRQDKMSDSNRNPRQKEYRKKRKGYKHIHRTSRRCREHRNKVILKNQLKCVSALWQTTTLVCLGVFPLNAM